MRVVALHAYNLFALHAYNLFPLHAHNLGNSATAFSTRLTRMWRKSPELGACNAMSEFDESEFYTGIHYIAYNASLNRYLVICTRVATSSFAANTISVVLTVSGQHQRGLTTHNQRQQHTIPLDRNQSWRASFGVSTSQHEWLHTQHPRVYNRRWQKTNTNANNKQTQTPRTTQTQTPTTQ